MYSLIPSRFIFHKKKDTTQFKIKISSVNVHETDVVYHLPDPPSKWEDSISSNFRSSSFITPTPSTSSPPKFRSPRPPSDVTQQVPFDVTHNIINTSPTLTYLDVTSSGMFSSLLSALKVSLVLVFLLVLMCLYRTLYLKHVGWL